MGPAGDGMAVVDQYCRVHGVQNLRVVDISICPDVVRANTNATAVMIGERAAAFFPMKSVCSSFDKLRIIGPRREERRMSGAMPAL